MKRLLAFLVAALCLSVGADARAHRRPHRCHAVAAKKAAAKKHRARRARRPSRSLAPLACQNDELVLSPPLLQQLQRNLVDGGYLRSPPVGHLTPRTRRALVDFQREYHLAATGLVDRPTAEALLGHDVVAKSTLASATK